MGKLAGISSSVAVQTLISLGDNNSQAVVAGVFFLAFSRTQMNRTWLAYKPRIPAIEKPNECPKGSGAQGFLLLPTAEDPLAIRFLSSSAVVTNDFYHDLTSPQFEPVLNSLRFLFPTAPA